MPKTAASKKSARRPSLATASKKAPAVVASRTGTGSTPAEALKAIDFSGLASEAAAKMKAAKSTATKPARETRVSLALELIKAGKSNAEVQAALVEKFALPESHDYYARWYRAHAVQKGIITKEFAKAHSRGPVVPAPVEKPAVSPAPAPAPASAPAKKATKPAPKAPAQKAAKK